MKTKTLMITTFIVLISSLSLANLYADESQNMPKATPKFDLFDADRGVEKKPESPPVQLPPPPKVNLPPPKKVVPPKRLLPQKDFVLRGTSRFGEKYIAVLQSPTGKEFFQTWTAEETASPIELKGLGNYTLLKVEPRIVHLGYPDDAPCRKSNVEAKGIECQGDGSAILTLVHRQAIAAPKQPTKSPIPPLKAELEKKKAQELQQKNPNRPFKRRVIKDEDVPPGMRVVRTPFGDRLVPNKNK